MINHNVEYVASEAPLSKRRDDTVEEGGGERKGRGQRGQMSRRKNHLLERRDSFSKRASNLVSSGGNRSPEKKTAMSLFTFQQGAPNII